MKISVFLFRLLAVFVLGFNPLLIYAQDLDVSSKWQNASNENAIDIMVEGEFSNRLFVVRCERRRLYAFVVWNEFVGTTPRVEYKTDKLPPKEQYWKSGTDGGSSFYPSRTIEFLKRIEKSESLWFKVTPIGKSPLTAKFDIKGIENALNPIKQECKWR